ncbi:MAG TPA: class I SAM-dependent methyltransferase [Gammaproteobacteria bacterium]|nr:class I SAM-dependent methyltransferase [Gammaproteobacteria bacterium]
MLDGAVRETPDIETASEAYAQRFAGAAGRYLLGEQEAAIRAVLADFKGGTVLDVGGGHAQLTALLRSLAGDVLVFGSDARGLERVRRDFPDCATATGNLLALPFAGGSFDVVVAVRLLPHVRNWVRLTSELCRVARSTIVVDYPRTTGFNGLTPLLFPLKKRLEGNTRHYRNFRDAEIDEVLHACGFEPRERRAQFLLPMVAHRRTNGLAPLRGVERAAKWLRLTRAFGSPVVVRADRCRT